MHPFGPHITVDVDGTQAVKCIRSIRRWSYEVFGNDRAIEVSQSQNSLDGAVIEFYFTAPCSISNDTATDPSVFPLLLCVCVCGGRGVFADATALDTHTAQFVVMVTPEDMQANAEFVRLADYHIEAMGACPSCSCNAVYRFYAPLTVHVPAVAVPLTSYLASVYRWCKQPQLRQR
jgi:hypothetical protein